MSYSPLFNEVNDFSVPSQAEQKQQPSLAASHYMGSHQLSQSQLVRSGSGILFAGMDSNFTPNQSEAYYADALRPARYTNQSDFEGYGPMLSNSTMRQSTSNEFHLQYNDAYAQQSMQNYKQSSEMNYHQDQYQLQQRQHGNQQPSKDARKPKESLFIPMNSILPSDVYSPFPTESYEHPAHLAHQSSTSTLINAIERDEPEVWALLEIGQDGFFRKCDDIVADLRKAFPERFTSSVDPSTGKVTPSAFDMLKEYALKTKSSKRGRGKQHTPRPSNSFILYRKSKHALIHASYHAPKPLNNNFISKMVAKWWKEESLENKTYWSNQATEEKRIHVEKFPDYKYRPKKPSSKHSTECMSGKGSARQSRVEKDSAESMVEETRDAQRTAGNGQVGMQMNYFGTPIAPNPHPTNQGSFTNNYANHYPYSS